MKKEIWKAIWGFEGWYEVSSFGRVRALPRKIWDRRGYAKPFQGKILRTPPDGFGYSQVNLSKYGKRTHTKVHLLVLETFVGPCPEGCEALHKDDVKKNNALRNLRWGTRLENNADKILNGKQAWGENQGSSKLTVKQVLRIRKSRLMQKDLAAQFGASQGQIHKVQSRKHWRNV
jgi:hypothetical protein